MPYTLLSHGGKPMVLGSFLDSLGKVDSSEVGDDVEVDIMVSRLEVGVGIEVDIHVVYLTVEVGIEVEVVDHRYNNM